jgi:hypothetical protein
MRTAKIEPYAPRIFVANAPLTTKNTLVVELTLMYAVPVPAVETPLVAAAEI